MNQGKRYSIMILPVVVALLVCWSPAGAAPPSVATRPAGNLDQYYGFGQMEILTFGPLWQRSRAPQRAVLQVLRLLPDMSMAIDNNCGFLP